MLLQQLKLSLEERLGNSYRYQHSLEVLGIAEEISNAYPLLNKKNIQIASLMHDVAKLWSLESCIKYAKIHEKDLSSFINYPSIIHAPIGALILEKEFNIYEQDILDSISYHTTGKENMSEYNMIVFIADYAASMYHQDKEKASYILLQAKKNLILTTLTIVNLTLKNLITQQRLIHYNSFLCYNWLVQNS